MNIQQCLKPVIAFVGSMLMCGLLTACQITNAQAPMSLVTENNVPAPKAGQPAKAVKPAQPPAPENVSRTRDRAQFDSVPGLNDNERTFYIDGKEIDWSQLTDKQKNKIRQLEAELQVLQNKLDINDDAMIAWSNKVEAISKNIDIDNEALESIEVDFEGKTVSIKDIEKISQAISKQSRQFEINMEKFDQEMHLLELEMPKIDEKTLDAIQAKSREIETIINQVATVK